MNPVICKLVAISEYFFIMNWLIYIEKQSFDQLKHWSHKTLFFIFSDDYILMHSEVTMGVYPLNLIFTGHQDIIN